MRRSEGERQNGKRQRAESRRASEEEKEGKSSTDGRQMKSPRVSHEEPFACRACLTTHEPNNKGITATGAIINSEGLLVVYANQVLPIRYSPCVA